MQRINFDFWIDWTDEIATFHNIDVEIEIDGRGEVSECDLWFDGRSNPVKNGLQILRAFDAEDLDWLIDTAKAAEGWVV